MNKLLILMFGGLLCGSISGNASMKSKVEQGRGIHVNASIGDNSFAGSVSAPLKTIQAAADKASPGDTVIVHGGVYREQVSPSRGGESMEKPIVFTSAKGEEVIIKGSEVVKDWEQITEAVWRAGVPNSIFGKFNPYKDTLYGDWFTKGEWCHTGEVYLNDQALTEAQNFHTLFQNKNNAQLSWHCQVEKDTTWIYANFGRQNPNKELAEINVRQSVFYPQKPFVNYLVVRGFKMSQAATPWAPPTAEQIGLLGTHWSKGWLIEDNIITHSKCVGITLGKYGDEWDNKSESEKGYVDCIKRALENGWNRDCVGSHIVRNNYVSLCGQAGIAGSLGAIYSRIEKNTIYDVALQKLFYGYEMAGLKLHGAVDVVIINNHIYRTKTGIWLDWMTQGTRVTSNFLHDNGADVSFEVNHGPILIDNNLFLSPVVSQIKLSQGMSFVNNLIAWKIWKLNNVDNRQTPYLEPHGTKILGYHDCPCGNVSYYNNIFLRTDMTEYDKCILPVQIEGNCYWAAAKPSIFENSASMNTDHNANICVLEREDGWYLQITMPDNWKKEKKRNLLTTQNLGKASIPNQTFNCEGEKPIKFDKYYGGKKRNGKSGFYPGPIDFAAQEGTQIIKVFNK